MMTRYLGMLILLLGPIQVSAYYKCTSEQGEVIFQEYPCPDAAKQVEEQIRGEHKSANSESVESLSKQEVAREGKKYPIEFVDDAPVSLIKNSLILSRVNSAVASLSPIKAILTQYHGETGRWPERFTDVGLSDRDLTSSQIDEVRLEAGGVIVARLNATAGDGKYIALQPRYVLGGTTVEWMCFANFTKHVLDYGGSDVCESRVIQ